MNERETALIVRKALDESVERLPWLVTHRLAAGRTAALARMAAETQAAPATEPVRVGARGEGELAGGSPRLGWRIAAVVLPIAFVVAGLAGISVWENWQRADDLADLDAAMLADDVPITAYADRGFGVYLKNVTQAKQE